MADPTTIETVDDTLAEDIRVQAIVQEVFSEQLELHQTKLEITIRFLALVQHYRQTKTLPANTEWHEAIVEVARCQGMLEKFNQRTSGMSVLLEGISPTPRKINITELINGNRKVQAQLKEAKPVIKEAIPMGGSSK